MTPVCLFFFFKRGRGGGGVQHVYSANFVLTVAYNGNLIINII